jgi:hypothetical protein
MVEWEYKVRNEEQQVGMEDQDKEKDQCKSLYGVLWIWVGTGGAKEG